MGLTLIAGLTCGVLTLVACAPTDQPRAQPPGEPIVLTEQANYDEALRRAYADFPWPADFRPDLVLLTEQTRPDAGLLTEPGLERIVLTIVHSCAWYLSWDAARTRGDLDAADAALRVIVDDIPKRVSPAGGGRELADEVAEEAQRGENTTALLYASANCDATSWLEPGDENPPAR